MHSQKVEKASFPSFRRKPESSVSLDLGNPWSPFFNGVTTFYEFINFRAFVNEKAEAEIPEEKEADTMEAALLSETEAVEGFEKAVISVETELFKESVVEKEKKLEEVEKPDKRAVKGIEEPEEKAGKPQKVQKKIKKQAAAKIIKLPIVPQEDRPVIQVHVVPDRGSEQRPLNRGGQTIQVGPAADHAVAGDIEAPARVQAGSRHGTDLRIPTAEVRRPFEPVECRGVRRVGRVRGVGGVGGIRGVVRPRPTKCECGGELTRKFTSPNVVYRGSGFYSIDKRLTPVHPLDYDNTVHTPADLKG